MPLPNDPNISDLLQAGARLCVGVDSHACGNAFEEVRAVELDERSRLEARHTVAEAPALLDAATRLGYEACGLSNAWQDDRVHLNAHDPSIAATVNTHASDAILFGATPRAVNKVFVRDMTIVEDGYHVQYEAALEQYQNTLQKLGLF